MLDASIAAAAILVLAAFGVLIAVQVFRWGRILDTSGLALLGIALLFWPT